MGEPMLSNRWAYLLRRLGLVLGLYSLLRLLFLSSNQDIAAGAGLARIAQAFGYGLRFDLSALAAINFPFVLLSFLPRRPPNLFYERFLKAVFLISNIPFLIINVIDLEFFQFTNRRFTWQSLVLAGDPG